MFNLRAASLFAPGTLFLDRFGGAYPRRKKSSIVSMVSTITDFGNPGFGIRYSPDLTKKLLSGPVFKKPNNWLKICPVGHDASKFFAVAKGCYSYGPRGSVMVSPNFQEPSINLNTLHLWCFPAYVPQPFADNFRQGTGWLRRTFQWK
jgi:hypothetical protein